MMTDDERGLIQALVDGELDAQGEAKARSLLESSAQARELREELERVTRWLEQAPAMDPPDELHGRIVSQLRLPSGPAASGLSLGWFSGLFRYGLATAAGVALTLAVLQLPVRAPAPGAEFDDLQSMMGSMVERPVGAEEILDQLELRREGADVEAWLARVDGNYRLELEVRAEDPVDFSVDWSANGLALAGMVPDGGRFQSLSWSQETLAARTEGPRRLSLLLAPAGDGASARRPGIELSLLQGDSTPVSGRLEFGVRPKD